VQKSANGREKTHTWDGVEMLVIGLGCRWPSKVHPYLKNTVVPSNLMLIIVLFSEMLKFSDFYFNLI